MDKPRLTQPVIYRSRTGDYSLAAMVIGTIDSLNPLGVEKGFVPPITDDFSVHLVVFTPGLPPVTTPPETRVLVDPTKPLGERVIVIPAEGALYDPPTFVAAAAFGGTYQEFNIPWAGPAHVSPEGKLAGQPAGTWQFA